MDTKLKKFVDFLSLVYHEGRYATILPDGSMRAAYQKLIDYFAKDFDPHRAWKKLQPVRQTASAASSATGAANHHKGDLLGAVRHGYETLYRSCLWTPP